MKPSLTSVTVNEAVEIILKSTRQKDYEYISIFDAQGLYSFDNISSTVNIPPMNNSAMDGYAVRSHDTLDASGNNPVTLMITGEISAGGDFSTVKVESNKAIRIMTGAPIPAGADAVIQFEDTEEDAGKVKIFRKIKPGENCRQAGEDISIGQTAIQKGKLIGSADTGLLASLNIKEVKVYKRPEVAVISTGNEIVDIGSEIKPGQIRNSNSYTLYSEIKKYKAVPKYIGIARDTVEDIKAKIQQALESDIIITTGGVSMGKYDFVRDVMTELGIIVGFEQVKMKPGRPCVFGSKGDKLFFGLPGNPVSTMISFLQFVRPSILKMMGATQLKKPVVTATLKDNITKKPGRIHFIRGYFWIDNGNIYVSTTGPQGSGILKSMSDANCLIILADEIEKVKSGNKVSIQLINHGEIN